MAPIPIAQPDGPKIRALIIERYPELTHAQAVRQVARKISRHPHSIYVITGRSDKPAASQTFIRQLARELGVRPSEISDMDDDTQSEPEPKVPAA
jgi:hypothetical protein